MRIVVIDFETYWDQTHTLSKMSPIEYCVSPKTQVISLGIKVDNYPTDVLFGEDKIRRVCDKLDWSNALVVGHHMSGFDAMLLAWRFGVRPRMWGCTLSMARPLHSKTTGNSLGALVEHYGLGTKDRTALVQTKGKRLEDFAEAELDAMREYNKADVEQCRALFDKLRPHYTAKELWHIDATIRMLIEPKFQVDKALLETALSVERDHKRRAILTVARHLKRNGIASEELETCTTLDDLEEAVRKDLASAPRFAKLLESLGVEVPMKPSPTDPKKEVPALAKTDEAFLALQEHEDEAVAAAARARLAVKSTLLETRIQAFLDASDAVGGYLPVPLNYCGADTTGRWSGWAYNPQNLPRIDPNKPRPSDALRKCLRAPRGYKVVVADQSGIELRVNHFLWQVPSSMELYRHDRKADLYRAFAAARYGIKPEEVSKDQRQLAKVAQLGLGFGAGWRTFQKVAKLMGGLELSDEEAEAVTTSWRTQYIEIVQGWRTCHAALQSIYDGEERPIDPWGLCITSKDGIRLPSGRVIRYPTLHIEQSEDGKDEWWYGLGRHRARIYAGKVTENCLAEGTLVLTDSGWKPIQSVSVDDLVHDGVEFVRHAGTVFKSVQGCIALDGVYMTPDHKVLTDDGWQEASQVQRPYRPDIRGVDCAAPGGVHGQDQPQHDLLPASARVEPGRPGSHTVTSKPVYDIVNCGPRHRFVVRGATGPMVVHNCVQALARDTIADNAVEFFRATGFRPSLMVHDELVYVVPESEAADALATLQGIMRTPPKWWPELITESEGDIADTYGDAK